MNEEFMGYQRPKGEVGVRNKIAIISSVVCVNHVVRQIADKVKDAVPNYSSFRLWSIWTRL